MVRFSQKSAEALPNSNGNKWPKCHQGRRGARGRRLVHGQVFAEECRSTTEFKREQVAEMPPREEGGERPPPGTWSGFRRRVPKHYRIQTGTSGRNATKGGGGREAAAWYMVRFSQKSAEALPNSNGNKWPKCHQGRRGARGRRLVHGQVFAEECRSTTEFKREQV